MEVELKAFKNRTQCVFTSEDASIIFKENGNFWTYLKGSTIRCPSLDKKYPGYLVHEVILEVNEFTAILPCKTTIVIQKNDSISHYNLTYPTVQASEPSEQEGGLVKISLTKLKMPDTSSLRKTMYRVLGKNGDNIIYIIKLGLLNPNPNICKDDATGEYYPYGITNLFVLTQVKKD